MHKNLFRTRPDRLWVPPSLLYNGYLVSFPWVKRPRRGVDHPHPSSAEVKERVDLYLYSPLRAFVASSRVTFTIYLYSQIPTIFPHPQPVKPNSRLHALASRNIHKEHFKRIIYSTLYTLMYGGHFPIRWNNAMTSKEKEFIMCVQ